ncbi:MAG: terminase small subunit [Roseibium sp.]|nr:terminase small subunit [Roseibium sp.]
MKKLNDKQQRFAQEYLIDLNATQAAIRAGYSEKTAYSQGQRLLKNVEIQELIQIGQEERAERTEITADRVLEELGKIGFANMKSYIRTTEDGDAFVDLSELTEDQAAAINEVTVEDYKDGRGEDARDVRRVKFKLSDKRAALVDIGKHLGMFIERKELTGKDGGPIAVSETPPSARLNAMLNRIAPEETGDEAQELQQ